MYTSNHNCYSYAFNQLTNKPWVEQQPGVISGYKVIYINTPQMIANNIKKYIEKDFPYLQEININEQIDEKQYYKVALFTSEGKDYHLYKYINGVWKHKPGPGQIQTLISSPLDNIYKSNGNTYSNYVCTWKVPINEL